MKANLIALMLVERIIKVYMSTDKGQPVPFQSRSLLNQKSQEKSRLGRIRGHIFGYEACGKEKFWS